MHYDFGQTISRLGTSSSKWEKYNGTEILPFWVADMDFAVAPEIQQALFDRLAHPIYGYTRASDTLVEAIVAHARTHYDWTIQADWLVWLPGVVSGLSAACRAYLSGGDQLLINPPIYHHFFQVHDASQNELLQVPLVKVDDRWTYDIDSIARAMTEKTRLLLLCSPHNPVGTVFTAAELRALVELAAAYDAIVVSDEIHCDLVLNEAVAHTPTALAAGDYSDRVVTLMSQSKTFNLAGMNCSFAIIPDARLREKFQAACDEVLPPLGTLALVSAEAAFSKGEPWRRSLINQLRTNLALIAERLDPISGLKLERCDATYLAWIDATGLRLNDPHEFFEQHGVGFSSGQQFGQPGYLRMNFACPEAMLIDGLDRIERAVKSPGSLA